MTIDELRDQIVGRVSELIAQGTSTDQIAYLLKGLSILEDVKANNAIVEALLKVGELDGKVSELSSIVSTLDGTWELAQTFKSALVVTNEVTSLNQTPINGATDTTNAAIFKYGAWEDIKARISTVGGAKLDIWQKDNFIYERAFATYNNNYDPTKRWALAILKNNTDTDQEIEISMTYSSAGADPRSACIFADGVLLWSSTSNTTSTANVSVTIPAGSGKVLYLQSSAYLRYDYNSYSYATFYLLRLGAKLTLPEGVEWDYEAYKNIMGGN